MTNLETANVKTQVIHLAEALLASQVSDQSARDQLRCYSDVPEHLVQLVHFLHHFVADGDIRARDVEYERIQREQLRRLIADAVEGD